MSRELDQQISEHAATLWNLITRQPIDVQALTPEFLEHLAILLDEEIS